MRHGLCAPLGRVAQPRLLAPDRVNPAGAANRGRLLWVTFLGKTRKVTGSGATPREVALLLNIHASTSPVRGTPVDTPPLRGDPSAAQHERPLLSGYPRQIHSLLGQRQKQSRQLLRQPLDVVYHGVMVAKDVGDIFVGFLVEVDAVGIDAFAVEFTHGDARIFDQVARVFDVDVGGFAVGQHQQ